MQRSIHGAPHGHNGASKLFFSNETDTSQTPHSVNTEWIPVFIGIGLGVLVGNIPIAFPGVPAPVKLGLAGGPLLAAIFLGRIGRVGPC